MTPTPHRTYEVSRIKRANQALRQCHQILARSAAEDALLRDVGQSLVAACRYDVVWIGSLAEVDKIDLRHEACATPPGAKGGVTLAELWNHTLERRTIGTAIRTKKAAVARDVLARSGASRSQASTRPLGGYVTFAALPAVTAGGLVAVLCVYASGAIALATEEIKLLSELAEDLAYGIAALRTRAERDRTIDELQRSTALLRAILDAAPAAIIGLDLNGRVHSVWNPAAEQMLGWSAEEAMGQVLPSVPAENQEEFKGLRDRVRRGETLAGVEVRRRRRDGTPIDYSIYAAPLADAGGRVVGKVAVLVDTTERKRSENALRESEERYRLLYERSPLGYQSLDENGCFVEVNQAWLDTLGYSRDEVIGRWCGDFLAPHQVELFRERFPHFKTAGKVSTEFEMMHKNGAIVPVAVSGRIGRDAAGRFQQTHCIITDITERKRAEQALRESELKYRLLVANASVGIVILQDGIAKFPNPRMLRMMGMSEEELLARPFLETIHAEDRATANDRIFRRPPADEPVESDPFRVVNCDGEILWVQLTAAEISWEGRPGMLCFLRDVSEQVALEAQFRQAQKLEAVGRLAGGVAHDFNNMLSVINGLSEVGLEMLPAGDRIAEYLKEILAAGERAATLTRQLLAFSRKQVLAPEVLDVNTLVAGIETMLRRLIGEDIEFETLLPPDTWSIKADAGQIEQIIMNLASNARDAMPDGGRLTVETANVVLSDQHVATHVGSSAGPHVMLAVTDTGCGMDDETMSRVFEPFFTTKEAGKGTGLGLATVYGIVSQSGGSVDIYSEPGEGTRFELFFPREEGAVETSPSERPAAIPGAGETVLVVEDEAALRRLVVRILKQGGYHVLEADNSRKAVVVAGGHAGRIDLLLTDVVMPQGSGTELAAQLVRQHPELRVLFMSGYTDRMVTFGGQLESPDALLQKPFGVTELLARVRRALLHDRRGGQPHEGLRST